jgi:hypothetical protein
VLDRHVGEEEVGGIDEGRGIASVRSEIEFAGDVKQAQGGVALRLGAPEQQRRNRRVESLRERNDRTD